MRRSKSTIGIIALQPPSTACSSPDQVDVPQDLFQAYKMLVLDLRNVRSEVGILRSQIHNLQRENTLWTIKYSRRLAVLSNLLLGGFIFGDHWIDILRRVFSTRALLGSLWRSNRRRIIRNATAAHHHPSPPPPPAAAAGSSSSGGENNSFSNSSNGPLRVGSFLFPSLAEKLKNARMAAGNVDGSTGASGGGVSFGFGFGSPKVGSNSFENADDPRDIRLRNALYRGLFNAGLRSSVFFLAAHWLLSQERWKQDTGMAMSLIASVYMAYRTTVCPSTWAWVIWLTLFSDLLHLLARYNRNIPVLARVFSWNWSGDR